MNAISLRLTAAFAVLVTCVTALLLALGGWMLHRQMINGMEFMHAAEFSEIAARLQDESVSRAVQIERVREHAAIDAPMYFFQLHDGTGRVLFRSANLGATVLPDLTGRPANEVLRLPPLGRLLESEFYVGSWHVQIASPLAQMDRLFGDYLRVSLLLLGLTVFLSVGVGFAFSRFALRPVRAIAQTAARINADNLGERVPVGRGRDEIAALATLLNQMFDRLEKSFAQVRRFTADASHELKTPLALVRLNAEKLRGRAAGDAEAMACIDDLQEELTRINRIIESLLFLAQADAGVLAPYLPRGNPQALVQSTAEDLAVLAEDRGMRFTLGRNEPLEAAFSETMLRQLLFNLAANAFAVMPAGGLLQLESMRADGRWRLEMTDEGPGLAEADLGRIFERFVRIDSTANGARGSGLGLAICRGISELHNGTIRAENRTDRRGLRVIVELPSV